MKANATILDKRLGILFQRQFQQSIRIFSMLCFLFFMNSSYATIYHVSKTGDDSNDGLAWGTSFLTLQKALQIVTAGDEIWVAKGTYYPDEGPGYTNNNRNHSFTMIEGVGIYGGFNGTETLKDDRDWANNETILSGDIDHDTDPLVITGSGSTLDISGNFGNSFNVVRNEFNSLSSAAILDGFSIIGGQGFKGCGIWNNYSSPTLSNLYLEGNNASFYGGAIALDNSNSNLNNIIISKNYSDHDGAGIFIIGSSTILNNVSLIGNKALLKGGGMIIWNNSNETFNNCSFDGNFAGESGGAIYQENNTTINLTDCSFTGNSAISGGGIYNLNSDPVLNGCTFTANTATNGGGMYNEASHPILNACIFSDNTSGSGGGMYNFNSDPVLTDCEFVTNNVQLQGGGMCNTDGSNVEIINCHFNGNNAASSSGGAVYNTNSILDGFNSNFINNSSELFGGAICFYHGGSSSFLNLNKCKLISNHSSTDGGAIYLFNTNTYINKINSCEIIANEANNGGGIFKDNCRLEITNSIIHGNKAEQNGGAFYENGHWPNANFINSSISGNSAGLSGGGLFTTNPFAIVLRNSILWNNSSEFIPTNSTINYSIIPTAYLSFGTGNSDKDPLFADQPDYNNAPSLDGDLHLTECSPAIDAGLDSYNTTTLDLDGLNRKFDAITGGEKIDMGAYEYQSLSAPVAICDIEYIAELNSMGTISFPVTDLDNGSTGCGPLSFTTNLGSGDFIFNCNHAGDNYNVTLYVTDVNGHSASCTTTVKVRDHISPTIVCPSNISVNNDANQCSALVTYSNATATDNCHADISYSKASGTSFTIGATTVVATATDASGNSSSCSFTVTVMDAQKPTVSCPNDITVNSETNTCNKVVTYAATASDNCPSVNLNYSKNSGSTFNVGTTTVTVTSTDGAGNTANCNFTVEVNDVTLPTLSCPSNIVYNLSSTECKKAISYSATASDNCGISSIIYSPASGSNFELGTSTVLVTATDVNGNTKTCSFTVTIKGDDDCDGVANACDVCPGGNDKIDSDNNGLPDCKYPPANYAQVYAGWKCGSNKVNVCHNGNNTLCVSWNAVSAHIGHGDYLGPCGAANCNNSLTKQGTELEEAQELLKEDQHEILLSVIPNPNYGQFMLAIDGIDGLQSQLEIMDPMGKVVFTQTIQAKNHYLEIPILLEHIASGQYVIKFSNERECISKKMIIIR